MESQPPRTAEVGVEESEFLISLIRKFESGVTEGYLHTLIYAGQSLDRMPGLYAFQFREMVPYSENLDLSIAMLLWHDRALIRDNRIRARPNEHGWSGAARLNDQRLGTVRQDPLGSLDKLLGLSYDALKVLAAMIHMERDLQKSRGEAVRLASRLFPIREDEALDLLRHSAA